MKEEKRRYTNVNVENPNVGKTTSNPQTAEYTMREEYSDREHRGNDLLHPFFATRWLQWRQRPLSLSLALSNLFTKFPHYSHNAPTNYIHKLALSHIYTHMTFGLFTHIAPRGSLEHILICVPSSQSGRLPPGLQSSGSSHFPSGGICFPTGLHAYLSVQIYLKTFRCIFGSSWEHQHNSISI